MNKNGVELSFNTIAILILIVLVLILFITAYRTQITKLFDILASFIGD